MSIPSFHQGDDVNFDVTVYEDAAKTTPKDLTGALVVGRIGLVSGPTTAVEMTGSVTDGPNGAVRAPLAAAESAALDASLYSFQLEVTLAGQKNIVTDELVRCRAALPDI